MYRYVSSLVLWILRDQRRRTGGWWAALLQPQVLLSALVLPLGFLSAFGLLLLKPLLALLLHPAGLSLDAVGFRLRQPHLRIGRRMTCGSSGEQSTGNQP